MEQKTEASQAVDEFSAWLAREMPAGTVISDPAWWAPRILRAALKAQPAPTEAQGEPNKQIFENIEELRSAATAVVARWDSPKWKGEAPTAEFIARLRQALAAPTIPAIPGTKEGA